MELTTCASDMVFSPILQGLILSVISVSSVRSFYLIFSQWLRNAFEYSCEFLLYFYMFTLLSFFLH